MTAQSNSQNVKVGIEQGAARMFVKSGGVLDIEPGGVRSQGGVPLKIARGQHDRYHDGNEVSRPGLCRFRDRSRQGGRAGDD